MVIIANQLLHHHHPFHPPCPHHSHLHPIDQVGLPLRREDGSCMAPSDTCNPLVILLKIIEMYLIYTAISHRMMLEFDYDQVCPNDCVPCDESDKCNVNFHETECSMVSEHNYPLLL